MDTFFLSQIPMRLYFIGLVMALSWAGYAYGKNQENSIRTIRLAAWSGFFLVFFFSVYLTFAQWYVWHVSRPEFLTLPLSGGLKLFGAYKLFAFLKSTAGGFFIFYAFGRFWLKTIIVFLCALVWWLLLKLLAKRRPDAVAPDELPLALLTALIAGWPGFVLYVPLTFIFMIASGVYHRIRKIDQRLPIGWPMIIASAIVLVAGSFLIDFFWLGVLKI